MIVTAMPLFSTTIILALIAIIALVVFAYRWTTSRQADYATVVRENDQAFQQVADLLGLIFVPGRITHHPVMGDIAAFGTAQGLYRNFSITLRVASDATSEPPVVFRLEMTLQALSGAVFTATRREHATQPAHELTINPSLITFKPRIACQSRSMSYVFFTTNDVQALQTYLNTLCDVGIASTLQQDAA